jgi:formamidopyrimidine-DNA glycosylase
VGQKGRPSKWVTIYRLSRKRPSPLSDAFDRSCFDRLVQESSGKLSAKAFLATEQRIPGLGSGVLQDILYPAALHPGPGIWRERHLPG